MPTQHIIGHFSGGPHSQWLTDRDQQRRKGKYTEKYATKYKLKKNKKQQN